MYPSNTSPRTERAPRPGIRLSPDDSLFLTLKSGVTAESAAHFLGQAPCEIQVTDVRAGQPGYYRVKYALPNGVFLETVYSGAFGAKKAREHARRSERPPTVAGVHKRLVITRQAGQGFRLRPAPGVSPFTAAQDLAAHGILIQLQSAKHTQASIVIEASACWSIVRNEIDAQAGDTPFVDSLFQSCHRILATPVPAITAAEDLSIHREALKTAVQALDKARVWLRGEKKRLQAARSLSTGLRNQFLSNDKALQARRVDLLHELSVVNDRLKAVQRQNTNDQARLNAAFVDAAKQLLPETEFHRLLQLAHGVIQPDESTDSSRPGDDP